MAVLVGYAVLLWCVVLAESTGGEENHQVLNGPNGRQLVERVKRQTQSVFCTQVADIVFVLDSTTSVTPDGWDNVLTFLQNLIEEMIIGPNNIQVGIVSYGAQSRLDFQLNEHLRTETVLEGIVGLTYIGEPLVNMSGAIWVMRTQMFTERFGMRPNAPKVAFIVTSSTPTVDALVTLPYAEDAKSDGITIITVGVGSEIDPVLLTNIASSPAHTFLLDSSDMLLDFDKMNEIAATACLTVKIVTEYHLNMESMEGSKLIGFNIEGQLAVAAELRSAIIGKGLFFDGVAQFLDFGDMRSTCFGNFGNCPDGATFAFWIWLGARTPSGFVMSSGGQSPDSFGIAIYLASGQIQVVITTLTQQWGPIGWAYTSEAWFHVTVTWHSVNGLILYINGASIGNAQGQARSQALTASLANTFTVGKPNDMDDLFGHFVMDEFYYWNTERDMQRIADFYANYQWIPTTSAPTTGGPTTQQALIMLIFNMDPDMFTNGLTGNIQGTFFTTPVIYAKGLNNMAVYFDGIQQFLEFGDTTGVCFGNLDLCPYGATYSFWIYFGSAQAVSMQRSYVLSSGTQEGGARGIAMYVEGGMLSILVATRSSMWGPVSVPVIAGAWFQVAFSWSINMGLWIYINGVQVGQSATPTSLPLVQVSNYNNLVLARPNDGVSMTGEFYMDDMYFWNTYQDSPFIADSYANYNFTPTTAGPTTMGPTTAFPLGTIDPNACHYADIIFVMDSSGSIGLDNWAKLLSFVQDIARLFRVGDDDARIGVVSFGNSARLEFHLNTHTEQTDLINAVGQTRWMDSRTNTSGGVWFMREIMFTAANGDRPDAPNIGIVVTDGASNVDPQNTIPYAQDAHTDGITMFAIGIGAGIVEAELVGIATSEDYKFEVSNFAALRSIETQIVKEVGESCRTAMTTVLPTSGGGCSLADVIFVMDSSGSITLDNWQIMLQFVEQVVKNLEVSPLHTQVGVVTYGSMARIQFHLNEFDNPTDAIAAIRKIRWLDEDTNTSGGIYAMQDIMFTQANGDRSRAPNIGIVMTDGASSRDADRTIPFAEEARKNGVVMFSIGIGESVNMDELLGIAGDEMMVFHVANFSGLGGIQSQISTLACEVPSTCTSIADIAIVLDTSSSIRTRNFVKVKDFIKTVLETVNIGFSASYVSLVTFSTKARVEFYLNELDSRLLVQEAIDNVRYYRGSTNTAAALKLIREEVFNPANGDRPKIRNIAVVLTDGGSNDFPDTVEQARLARQAGINILVVAISQWVNMMEIHEMATDPDDANAFMVDNFDDFDHIIAGLESSICDEINECDSNPCQNGGSCVDGLNNYMCICVSEYAGISCEAPCAAQMDLVLVVDSSGSIGVENFELVLKFVKSVTASLNPSQAQVGMMTFDNQANPLFQLNTYTDMASLLSGISFSYTGGTTNTSDALQTLMTMFTPENGDRPDAPNYALVVTDGRSNNKTLTYAAARQVKAMGIKVMVVAIDLNDQFAQRELRGIASDPDDMNLMSLDNFTMLPTLLKGLVDSVCNSVDECASGPCIGSGSICQDGLNSYTCICARGWSGRNCERRCSPQADIVIVVDSSGSIRSERFRLVQNFLISVLSEFNVGPDGLQVGAVMFSDNATIQWQMGDWTNKEELLQAVDSIRYVAGMTNTADALKLARGLFATGLGDRLDVPNFVILITDGQSNVRPERTLPEAIQTRLAAIQIIVVSVGLGDPNLEIKGMASDPDSVNILSVLAFQDLPILKETLVSATCDEVNECSSGPCRNNARCFNGIQNYICDCNDVYTGINCDRRCNKRYDVVFVIDGSGSIAGMEYTFDLSLKLAKQVVYGLNFAQERTRVGVTTFSDLPNIRFHLNEYVDRQSILNALAMRPEFGKTATSLAIDTAQNTMFTAGNGDRDGVPNVMFVISDGYSNVDRDSTIPTADAARAAGTTVFSIGVGHDGCLDPDEIRGIANTPDYQYSYIMPNETTVFPVAQSILDVLCDS